jgi:hypothetical protein
MWNYGIQLSKRRVRMGFGSFRYFYEIIHLFMCVIDLGFCELNSYNDVLYMNQRMKVENVIIHKYQKVSVNQQPAVQPSVLYQGLLISP